MDTLPSAVNRMAKVDNDIILAKNGDKFAFERLIEANEASLYRVANSILRNEADAEDAYQETIIKAYKGIVNLKKNEYFKSWLIKIMINECNYIIRKRKKTVSLEVLGEKEINSLDNHEKLELWTAVKSLETELRTVIILFYYEDFKQSEIAEILGIPDGTVKSRMARAKEKLRVLLHIKL
jgi:RNA polymerase sigma-70 factor, ECF subfamily